MQAAATASAPAARRGRWQFPAVAALAVTAIALTACGSEPAPAAPRTSSAVTVRSAAADARAEASGYARRLLASLRLPAGARRQPWPSRPPAILSPALPLILSDTVDLTAMYELGSRPAAVEAFLLAHRPAGLTTSGWGDSTRSGVMTSIFVSYSPATFPGGIYTAELDLTFTAVHGGTLLRADSFVAWFPARGTARQLNPADYTAVTIRWQHGYTVTTRTLTSRRSVRQFARLYNALHGAPDGVTSCPAEGAGPDTNTYQVVFGPAHGAPRVAVTPSNCLTVGVRIGGQPAASLYPATPLLSAAARVTRPR